MKIPNNAFINFRLEDNSERNALKSSLASVKIRRKKRHRLRKTLLVLDYVVECCGCFFIFCVFFIAKTVFVQHVLLSVSLFIYGILIPISYLLNETRVRNIIINQGWIEGFKSIFYSDTKRKRIKKRRIIKRLHPEGFPKNLGGFVQKNILENPIQRSAAITSRPVSNEEVNDKSLTNQISQTGSTLIPTEYFQVKKESPRSPKKFIRKSECQNTARPSSLPIESIVDIEQPPNNAQVKTEHHSLKTTLPKTKIKNEHISQPRRTIRYEDVIEVIGSPQQTNYGSIDSAVVSVSSDDETEDGVGVDEELVDSAFMESNNTLFQTLVDDKFKTFARTHILKHMSRYLDESSNDSDYLKYFQYLCYLDGYSEIIKHNQRNIDLFVALINSWRLSQRRPLRFKNGEITLNVSTNAKDIDTPSKLIIERKRLIGLLFFNVSLDKQYKIHLRELCEMEEFRDNNQIVSIC